MLHTQRCNNDSTIFVASIVAASIVVTSIVVTSIVETSIVQVFESSVLITSYDLDEPGSDHGLRSGVEELRGVMDEAGHGND